MLYSQTDKRLFFAVNKDLLQGPIEGVVDSVHATIKEHQLRKLGEKREVNVDLFIRAITNAPYKEKLGFESSQYSQGDLVRDDTYYLDMAAFEFQNTDFLVPTTRFLQESDDISSIFGVDSKTIGTCIRLPGVTANAFRGLLKYLYPPVGVDHRLTMDDWSSILELSTKWMMLSIRQEAIQKLNIDSTLTDVMKVKLGTECKVVNWVRSGYLSLIERQEHFTVNEVEAIGLHRATKLCELKEQGYAEEWDIYINRFTLEAHGKSNIFSGTISSVVGGEADDHDDDLVTALLEALSLGNRRFLSDAWERIAKRTESLTLDEAKRLTLPTVVKAWEVRLDTRRAASSLVQDFVAPDAAKTSTASQRFSDLFGEELRNVEVDESTYTPLKRDKGKTPVTGGKIDEITEPAPKNKKGKRKAKVRPSANDASVPGIENLEVKTSQHNSSQSMQNTPSPRAPTVVTSSSSTNQRLTWAAIARPRETPASNHASTLTFGQLNFASTPSTSEASDWGPSSEPTGVDWAADPVNDHLSGWEAEPAPMTDWGVNPETSVNEGCTVGRRAPSRPRPPKSRAQKKLAILAPYKLL